MEYNPDSRAARLQQVLVQTCIDFIKENNDTVIDRVVFNADCLQLSAKEGSWQPCTDSYCSVEVWDDKEEFYVVESESC